MKIVLACWGSHGDVDPILGVALGLRARGHEVSIATAEYFRDLVLRNGLGYHPIRPNGDPTDAELLRHIMDRKRGSERLLREVLFPAIDAMYEDLDKAAGGADLLVSHPATFAAPIVAEQRRLAWASTVLAPLSFFSATDCPVFPPAPWLKKLDRFGMGPVLARLARASTTGWSASAAALRRRLGLGPGENPIFDGQHSPHLVLALFSRVLADPQPDWPPNVEVTGHPFHDAPHGTTLAPELEAFLQAGAPPVVFTLGSAVVHVAGDFWTESVGAVRLLGERAVLLAGPGKAAALQPILPPNAIALDVAPHSLLFPRASVVVQQCGIGTTAQSLRSGRPMLAVPFSHDQPDNAYRATRLGMARTLYPGRYKARRVAGELGTLLADTSYSSAAEQVASQVRLERGAEAACDALERVFTR